MKFNMSSAKENSLYDDALNFAGISDTSQFPLTEFTRNTNNWSRKADSWIWQATGTWEFDDSKWTSLPIATATIVDEQQDYEIPSTARKIDRVEVLDTNSNYQLVTPIDKSQITTAAMSEFYETPGFPKYYDLIGRSLFLYPKPSTNNVTAAAGLKMYVSRDIDEFAVTDTSTEPGFDNHFHRIVSLGSAYDYCLANGIEDRQKQIKVEIEQIKTEMHEFYGARHRDFRPRILPVDSDGI